MGHINRNLNIICCVYGFIFIYAIGLQDSTLPPDPNNAALLYYQAFLLRPEPDYAEEQLVYNTRAEKIYDLLCGGELDFDPDIDKKIQEFEDKLKNDANEPDEIMPKLMEVAPEDYDQIMIEVKKIMPEGFLYDGIQFKLSELHKRREHELKMRGVDPNKTIRTLLGYMGADIDTLIWLKNKLVAQNVLFYSPAKVLNIDFELALQSLRIEDDIPENARMGLGKKEEIKALLREEYTNVDVNNNMRVITDEELIELAGEPYAAFLDSSLQVIDSDDILYEIPKS